VKCDTFAVALFVSTTVVGSSTHAFVLLS
jgi:hypothetical protein